MPTLKEIYHATNGEPDPKIKVTNPDYKKLDIKYSCFYFIGKENSSLTSLCEAYVGKTDRGGVSRAWDLSDDWQVYQEPKKTVKMYLYASTDEGDDRPGITTWYYRDDEDFTSSNSIYIKWFKRLDWSEIEVEQE